MRAPTDIRLAVSERHLRLLLRCVRESSAAGLLRFDEQADAGDLVALLDAKLPSAEERHPAGRLTGEILLAEDVLRVLAAAEDEGRSCLSHVEVDLRLSVKPEGTSIRASFDRLRRDRLVSLTGDGYVTLTQEGRTRARRPVRFDKAEHAVAEPEQLLDLVFRAKCGGTTRWVGGETIDVEEIWHVPMVQACSGVDQERFDCLLSALAADGLIGAAEGSYRTITKVGIHLGCRRAIEQRIPSRRLYELPGLLPPVRKPGEILRRREDMACPHCGWPAGWLRSRSSKRYDELRTVGMSPYRCTSCDLSWTVYAEPVDRAGRYDPFGNAARCRVRWALLRGHWDGPALAPPDHWRAP
jgi:hypothetical protein